MEGWVPWYDIGPTGAVTVKAGAMTEFVSFLLCPIWKTDDIRSRRATHAMRIFLARYSINTDRPNHSIIDPLDREEYQFSMDPEGNKTEDTAKNGR